MPSLDCQSPLPRLLDLDNPPSVWRIRWYLRYLQRWRKELFRVWRQDVGAPVDGQVIGEGVDNLIGLGLLLEHIRRSESCELPLIEDFPGTRSHLTLTEIATAVSERLRNRLLAAALRPDDFGVEFPIPNSVVGGPWERRIADATWLVFRDRGLPMSVFGDFHQLCKERPLASRVPASACHGTRRSIGMYYTPAPIVDYLVSTSLSRLLDRRTPDELRGLRVVDPSCGCGAFLIGSLRFLVRWNQQQPGCAGVATENAVKLMQSAFRGCDIDSKALQSTARLLLFAVWQCMKAEGPSVSIDGETPVPDFRPNLSCMSFLGPDAGDGSPFPEPKHDAVIGGPPFVRLEELHRTQKEQLLLPTAFSFRTARAL